MRFQQLRGEGPSSVSAFLQAKESVNNKGGGKSHNQRGTGLAERGGEGREKREKREKGTATVQRCGVVSFSPLSLLRSCSTHTVYFDSPCQSNLTKRKKRTGPSTCEWVCKQMETAQNKTKMIKLVVFLFFPRVKGKEPLKKKRHLVDRFFVKGLARVIERER